MAILVAACWVSLSSAGGKVALVIGNSNYVHVPSLPNPANDAGDLSQVLSSIGFDVTVAKDLDFDGMRRTLRRFGEVARGSRMAMVFYAGHGIEVDKQNYLIPTDAKLASDRDIEFEAIPLGHVSHAVDGASELSLVLLDACRDNPFAAKIKRSNSTRSIGRGLSSVEPEAGTLISFAAREGTVASDGNGRNSPYTKALIEQIRTPGLEVNFLFRKVRDAVISDTGGEQEPFTYGSLPGREIFLLDPLDGSEGANESHSANLDNTKQGFTAWMTGSEYQADFNLQVRRKHYPHRVEGTSRNGQHFFRASYKPYPDGMAGFYSHHGMSQSFFIKRDAELRAQGFKRLFKQEFSDAGGTRIQATWIK